MNSICSIDYTISEASSSKISTKAEKPNMDGMILELQAKFYRTWVVGIKRIDIKRDIISRANIYFRNLLFTQYDLHLKMLSAEDNEKLDNFVSEHVVYHLVTKLSDADKLYFAKVPKCKPSNKKTTTNYCIDKREIRIISERMKKYGMFVSYYTAEKLHLESERQYKDHSRLTA